MSTPASVERQPAYNPVVLWEAVFMLVILKIPVFYLCAVVLWAVRAEPRPYEPALAVESAGDRQPPYGGRPRSRRPRPGPHGAPARRYARRAAHARPRVDR